MTVIIVPFHDWRKINLEGFRTRDAHFIEELSKQPINNLVIVNRPTTILEIYFKRKGIGIQGNRIFNYGPFSFYQLKSGIFLAEYISSDLMGQILFGYKWFIKKYKNKSYAKFILNSLEFIEGKDDLVLLNQNVFASGISKNLSINRTIFDAWDNFLKFNVYKRIKELVADCYIEHAYSSKKWITNSSENMFYFKDEFPISQIHLVTNGVSKHKFLTNNAFDIPFDMKEIPRPIIGFGGKITQLLDVNLINEVMSLSPNASFVFVGQLLDKKVFAKINKGTNFFYLGDKHYDVYPNYVKHFDICIVPYVVKEELKSGANTIKVYEYLSTGKKVVGTAGSGLEALGDYVYIVNNAMEFAEELTDVKNKKDFLPLESHSWSGKVQEVLNILSGEDVRDKYK